MSEAPEAGTAVLEISDLALRLFDGAALREESPCCAVADGSQLLLGWQAWERARLNPRQTYDRFWAQLDQQPLHRPAGAARSHADLAWFHLRALWEAAGEGCAEVVLAVPPDWDREQLALLLGIARACEIPVVGLVSAPVAAVVAAGGEPGDVLYLDAHQQRLRATRIHGDEACELGPSFEVSRHGMAALHDRFATRIAEEFLHESRFDPLHRAATEQLLYCQLPRWLQAACEAPSVTMELRVESRSYRVELSRQALVDAVATDYRALASSLRDALREGDRVLVADRLSGLPGLLEALTDAGLPVAVLPQDAVCRGVRAGLDRIRSDSEAPAYVTRLPRLHSAGAATLAPSAPQPDEERPPTPTHVLQGWRAWPLGPQPLGLTLPAPSGRAVDGACRVRLLDGEAVLEAPKAAGARLNGEAVTGERRLHAGDRLQAGGDWLFICAGDGHGKE